MKNKKKNFFKLKDNFFKEKIYFFIYMKVFIIAEVILIITDQLIYKKLINTDQGGSRCRKISNI